MEHKTVTPVISNKNNQADTPTRSHRRLWTAGILSLALLVSACEDNDDSCASNDNDCDGVINTEDAFPDDPSETTDTDQDGTGDNSDTDIDGDGILNENDPTPYGAAGPGGGGAAGPPIQVTFHFDPADGGGTLVCNGVTMEAKSPTTCLLDNATQLTIKRVAWPGDSIVHPDYSITGSCGGSFIASLTNAGQFNIVRDCIKGNDPVEPRKDATGTVLLEEWYADLPWHQKLSTKDSNLIDIPFVMPFEALPADRCPDANTNLEQTRCMLRYGIVNVMGMHRTDTLYKADEVPASQTCGDECVEVKLKVQRFHTLTDDPKGYAVDTITNNGFPSPTNRQIPSLGFAVTEATVFAPWMPWYTGHYCAMEQDNLADSVCYEDYFTTQIQAPADPDTNEAWLRDAPAMFEPAGTEPGYTRFCKSGEDACTLYLGKVDWIKDATAPKVAACTKDPVSVCETEINTKTESLERQFNASLNLFTDVGRFPWSGANTHWTTDDELAAILKSNPFLGYYELERYSENGGGHVVASLFKASHYVLPVHCAKDDFLQARKGQTAGIDTLSDCALNYEIHTSGFHDQWKELYGGTLTDSDIREISKALPGTAANQYGRTMFMYAGVPEQHIPVSFTMLDDGISIHDKMYSASRYTQYLPMVNAADLTHNSKSYTDAFWHAFFMSNHMNQTPDHFIRGVRGRTLWHNEYRSNIMYQSAEHGQAYTNGTEFENLMTHRDFPSGFQPAEGRSPFHGNTCDACHVRNGSGIPLMPNGQLPQIHVDRGMNPNFIMRYDYTYSNKHQPSMKMVLFDVADASASSDQCDNDDHSGSGAASLTPTYQNKIMNFYGNSFHVNQHDNLPTYQMVYLPITASSGYEVVDTTARNTGAEVYTPMRVAISNVQTGTVCTAIATKPAHVNSNHWPANCADVAGDKVGQAIENGEIGFMHLLGKRLGNSPLIEMIPGAEIKAAQTAQADADSGIGAAGCYGLVAGTRDGGAANYRNCSSGVLGETTNDCYISRWGWIGDRASLEDQVANAANVEMNITSTASYQSVHPGADSAKALVRYNNTVCGAADAECQSRSANSDITEQEIKDMATYQRWIGIPQRSEYQVASAEVQAGEKIFNELQCQQCHVIKKIAFDMNDNILPDEERENLQRLLIQDNGETEYPYVAYLGTDLLMHDMGYLSQVAKAPIGQKLRNNDGIVKTEYKAYVQKIRTPALKGLRFNRFVTDANHNTQKPIGAKDVAEQDVIPGCDFLLHDGRACDVIEAAYLHDGPAIKKLGTIEALNQLSDENLKALRAFLYSL